MDSENYQSLNDPHLNAYFNNKRIRRHLIKAGLINRRGDILPSKSHDEGFVRREKQKQAKAKLSYRITNYIIEEERNRQRFLRDAFDLATKRSRVQKMREGHRRKHRSMSYSAVQLGKGPAIRRARTPSPPLSKRSPVRPKSAHPPPVNVKNRVTRRPLTAKPPSHIEYCQVTMIYYGPPKNLEHKSTFLQPNGDEIIVMQQHCGGENLVVFKGFVKPNEIFTFDSRRHPDFPFALAIYINGLIDSRISVCCEYKHKHNVRLGSKYGLFGIFDVQKSQPCRMCRFEQRKKKLLEGPSLDFHPPPARRTSSPTEYRSGGLLETLIKIPERQKTPSQQEMDRNPTAVQPTHSPTTSSSSSLHPDNKIHKPIKDNKTSTSDRNKQDRKKSAKVSSKISKTPTPTSSDISVEKNKITHHSSAPVLTHKRDADDDDSSSVRSSTKPTKSSSVKHDPFFDEDDRHSPKTPSKDDKQKKISPTSSPSTPATTTTSSATIDLNNNNDQDDLTDTSSSTTLPQFQRSSPSSLSLDNEDEQPISNVRSGQPDTVKKLPKSPSITSSERSLSSSKDKTDQNLNQEKHVRSSTSSNDTFDRILSSDKPRHSPDTSSTSHPSIKNEETNRRKSTSSSDTQPVQNITTTQYPIKSDSTSSDDTDEEKEDKYTSNLPYKRESSSSSDDIQLIKNQIITQNGVESSTTTSEDEDDKENNERKSTSPKDMQPMNNDMMTQNRGESSTTTSEDEDDKKNNERKSTSSKDMQPIDNNMMTQDRVEADETITDTEDDEEENKPEINSSFKHESVNNKVTTQNSTDSDTTSSDDEEEQEKNDNQSESISTTKKRNDEELLSTQSEKAPVRQYRPVENIIVVWLDSNIDNDNDIDTKNSKYCLRQITRTLRTFTDLDKCLQLFKEIKNEKIFLIVSGSLSENILEQVRNDYSQLVLIYIFCQNKDKYEHLTDQYSKIKGIFTDINMICDQVKIDSKQWDNDLSTFLVTTEINDDYQSNAEQLLFIQNQLFKDYLLEITYDENSIHDLSEYCQKLYAENEREIDLIKQFEENYNTSNCIEWYTKDSFLYHMLNRAIRMKDIKVLFQMGFIIRDIHKQLEDIHSSTVHRSTLTLYRGQGIKVEDFEQLKQNPTGFLSFNGFISTSRKEDIARDFAQRSLTNGFPIAILFQIKIDPKNTSTPFISLENHGSNIFEYEYLLSYKSIFHIEAIEQLENNLWTIHLNLTNEISSYIQNENQTYHHSNDYEKLGELLIDMNELNKAKDLYEINIPSSSNPKYTYIYRQLALIHTKLETYNQAILYYNLALQTKCEESKNDYPMISNIHYEMGEIYYQQNKIREASDHVQHALAIQSEHLSSDHIALTKTYNLLGMISESNNDYETALMYYQLQLNSQEEASLTKQSNIASIHYKIANCLENLNRFTEAMDHIQQSIDLTSSDDLELGERQNLLQRICDQLD